ncbi:MAG: hypothetical protein AB7I50_03100 [Vicinamibacterales bacterium]
MAIAVIVCDVLTFSAWPEAMAGIDGHQFPRRDAVSGSMAR